MKAEWVLYYAMVATQLLGGGYTLVRGRRVQRLVLLILAIGDVLQLVGCAALVALHVAISSVSVNFDLAVTIITATSLVGLMLRYPDADWIVALVGLQACNMALDGFIFDENWADLRSRFADAANVLVIAEITVLALATARARRPAKPPPTAFYKVEPPRPVVEPSGATPPAPG